MIYLDNAATTFPKPEAVYKAMDDANRNLAVNAGRGSYRLARSASECIQEAKAKLRNLVNAPADTPVIFSPSITIAMNQIIKGYSWTSGANIYVSPYEHNAVARTVHSLQKEKNINIIELPIDEKSMEIDLQKAKYMFAKEKPDAVFCTHVSNVTGYILPIKEIFDEAKRHGAMTVLDTAQSLGLIEFDSRVVNADIIAFTGHKTLYGPFGIGGFLNIGNVDLKETIVGGTGSSSLNLEMPNDSEQKYEPASNNIVAIFGLNVALDCVRIEENFKHEKELTEYLLRELKKISEITVYSPEKDVNRIGVVSFSIEEMSSDDVGIILDEDFDIAVRTGYHCSPFIHKYLNTNKSLGTIRIGLSQFNEKAEIDALICALKDIVR